jgi:hypothetical protein
MRRFPPFFLLLFSLLLLSLPPLQLSSPSPSKPSILISAYFSVAMDNPLADPATVLAAISALPTGQYTALMNQLQLGTTPDQRTSNVSALSAMTSTGTPLFLDCWLS